MTTQFIVTVYYTNNTVMRYNFIDLVEACARAKFFSNQDRKVHKVELSVIIHTWK